MKTMLEMKPSEREYCCPRCGLIYFGYWNMGKYEPCPECGNEEVHACFSFGWAYAKEGIVEDLKQRGKAIHYQKGHPFCEVRA